MICCSKMVEVGEVGARAGHVTDSLGNARSAGCVAPSN